jgi:WD40-like Beta Propeller Repeat
MRVKCSLINRCLDNGVRAIIRVVYSDNGWGEPEVASFSGVHSDLEAAFSPDGSRIFFASDRPLNQKDTTRDYNIWMVERDETAWGNAQPLPNEINSDENEYYPSVAANGNLYFTACYEDCKGIEDIYVSRKEGGEYLTPVSLDTNINSATYEFNAFIAPDESFLIFGS